ncbi:sulfite exporter TauE/SafE family protein, partial [Pseudomonas sp. BGM005]|nr:sulfite exporter TauE/SafE family protein [Pseudomonas sp. BG5]
MPQDLSFYYAAVPAVLLVGLAKGGMGDALSLIGLPFLALVVSPVEAAAILLPILVFMDMISLVVWRKHGDWTTLKIMLPGAIFGIGLGWATSALVPGNILRIVI